MRDDTSLLTGTRTADPDGEIDIDRVQPSRSRPRLEGVHHPGEREA